MAKAVKRKSSQSASTSKSSKQFRGNQFVYSSGIHRYKTLKSLILPKIVAKFKSKTLIKPQKPQRKINKAIVKQNETVKKPRKPRTKKTIAEKTSDEINKNQTEQPKNVQNSTDNDSNLATEFENATVVDTYNSQGREILESKNAEDEIPNEIESNSMTEPNENMEISP